MTDLHTNGFPARPESWKWQYQRGRAGTSRKTSRMGRLTVQTVIALAASVIIAFFFHRLMLAGTVAGIGSFILFCGLFIPRLYAAIERLIGKFAFSVGQALTWILLVPFYYFCFLPARMLLLLKKHDPMKRAWDSTAPTYWSDTKNIPGNNRMTKQY